jgi:hypothetical protein
VCVGGGAASGFDSLGEAGGLGSGQAAPLVPLAQQLARLSMEIVQLPATSTRPVPVVLARRVAVSYSPDSAYIQRYLFSCKLCLQLDR